MSTTLNGLRLTNAEHFRWLVSGRLPDAKRQHFEIEVPVANENPFGMTANSVKAALIARGTSLNQFAKRYSQPAWKPEVIEAALTPNR